MADYVFEDPFDDSLEDIMGSLLEQVENIWPDEQNRPDTREGSLIWTLLSPIAFEIQRFQADLNSSLELGFLQFTFGEFLDLRGIELGLPRKEGANAAGILRFLGETGTEVPVGASASTVAVTEDVEAYQFSTTAGGVLVGVEDPDSVNEIQYLRVNGTADFTITLDGQTTGSLPYNATDVQIKTALDLLSLPTYGGSVGAGGGVVVSGNALSGATITFSGTNTQYKDLPLMTVNPLQVSEKQKLQISGTGSFRLLFDSVLSGVTLNETATIADFISHINTEIAPLSSSYPYFVVTTDYPATSDAITNEFNIIFGGTASYTDVPLITIVPEAGSTITPTTTTLVNNGADLVGGLDDEAFVLEIQRGRDAKPVAIYSNVNEEQSLDLSPAELEVAVTSLGAPANKNKIEKFKLSSVPTGGSFKLILTLDGKTYKTGSISHSADIAALKSAIENTPNANLTTGDISITSPTSSTNINQAGAEFHIEYVNNLRSKNTVGLSYSSSDNSLTPAAPSQPNPSISVFQSATNGANSVQVLKYGTAIEYSPLGLPTGTAFNPASGGNFRIILDDGHIAQITPPLTEDPIPYNVTAGSLRAILNSTITNPEFGSDGVNEIIRVTNTASSSWSSGSYRVVFNNGVSSETTANISYNATKEQFTNALTALSTIDPSDIIVTGSSNLINSASYFDIEFTGQYATNNMLASAITFVDASPASVPNISLDVDVSVEQNGVSSIFGEGTSFEVTGGPLTNTTGLTIQFKGKNANKRFNKISIVNDDFSSTTSSGNLLFTTETGAGGSLELAPLDLTTSPLTQDVENIFNAADPAGLDSGAVRVRVANGVQTLQKTAGPLASSFTITVDNGFEALTTPPLDTSTANAAAIEAAINGLDFTMPGGLYSPSVQVVGSGAVDSTNVFTIYFDSATEHTTNDGPLFYKSIEVASAATFSIGPSLTDAGALYEIEYVGEGPSTVNDVAGKNIDLSASIAGTDFQPTVLKYKTAGAGSDNTKYFVALTHPSGYIRLKWGSGATSVTSPISPQFDTAESIKYKLEELTDIPAGALTVTGGPFGVNPVAIEFSGGALNAANQPMIEVVKDSDTFLVGGMVIGMIEDVPGHGNVGNIEDVQCTYKYTLVTKLGVQDSLTDPDYESGYGETKPSPASTTTPVLTGNKIQVQIKPVNQGAGLTEIKAINVYRSIDGATFKLIGTINEDDLRTFELGSNPSSLIMSIEDNLDELTFNGIVKVAPNTNTTGVVELSAVAEEILDVDGNFNGSKGNADARSIENLDDVISGIVRVTNPEAFAGGSDREDDEAYRTRLIEFAQKDPGAGNISDYVSWAKEIEGVEGVAVIPEWQEIYGPLEGPGTVKIVLSGADSTEVSDATIEQVRSYIAGTTAIPDPDQVNAPAIVVRSEASGETSTLEDGIYEYVYTFINTGKGETKPSAPARVEVSGADNVVDFYISAGQVGVGAQNTIGRRVYRKKLNLVTGDPVEAGSYCLVAEILNNTAIKYTDLLSFSELPQPVSSDYQRRKAPLTNSTSLFDGVAPIGAHISIESITDETVWVSAEIYPASGWSVDGSGGRSNLTAALDTILQDYFAALPSGQDVKITNVMNIIHDHPGVADFRNTRLYSPLFPTGTTDNIPIGSGVTAVYSTAGTFSTWLNYSYDS